MLNDYKVDDHHHLNEKKKKKKKIYRKMISKRNKNSLKAHQAFDAAFLK